MRFFIKTFGCKQNHYESELIREMLILNGHEYSVSDYEKAIIHSCAVTGKAEYKTRDFTRRMVKRLGATNVAVIGCSADYHADDYRDMGIVAITGNADKLKARTYDALFGSSTRQGSFYVGRFDSQTRAFLSIQDGCDFNCAYCIITKLRGPSLSRPSADIIAEAGTLIKNGKKEIVITGVNIGLWGKKEGLGLHDLIAELVKIKDVRFRLSSLDPNQIDEKLLKYLQAGTNIAPHLHISLQSASDDVLKKHNRSYTGEMFRDLTYRVKENNPGTRIGIDIIAGLPGESDKDFLRTTSILEESDIDYMHIFKYSGREGTAAAAMPQVPSKTINERAGALHGMDKKIRERSLEKYFARIYEVIAERPSGEGIYIGISENYIECAAPGIKQNELFKFVPEKIKEGMYYGRKNHKI